MIIGIDGNEANIKDRVGTGQYAYNILTHFAKHNEHVFHIYLTNKPVDDLPKESDNWHYHVISLKYAWTRFALPLALFTSSQKLDVFWNPAHYLPPIAPCRSVVTIHDLAYEYYPDLFLPRDLYKLRNWTKASVKLAHKVIAVSQATKNDLIKFYHVKSEKIEVIYNGYDQTLFNTQIFLSPKDLDQFGLTQNNYILFVGTLQPRKNIQALCHAFEILKDQGYQGKLVIAGKIGWMSQDTLQAINSSRFSSDIVTTGYIEDDTRQLLYRFASVVALPSLYEGFGVPLIEAMASGTPVVGSQNSSIPEVVGEGGLLFDPKSPKDIAEAISNVIANRQDYQEKALLQAQKFSWDKCAQDTLDALIKVQ